MKKLLILILAFFVLSISVLSHEKNDARNYESEMISMIKAKDYEAIETLCKDIASQDSSRRNHQTEARLVRIAIDSLDPDALLSLYENRIGFFDPDSDSISPLDYLFNEDFADRVIVNLQGKDSLQKSLFNLNPIMYGLIGFQALNLDSTFFIKMENRFNSLLKKLGEDTVDIVKNSSSQKLSRFN